MQFHLNHIPEKFDFEINHSHRILLIGSCFTENIGTRLGNYKFNLLTNPCGILFNPQSILQSLNNIMNGKKLGENNIIMRNGMFYSYLHHSSVHADSKLALIALVDRINATTSEFLKNCDCLVLTFGTAFIYELAEQGQVVANCHKQPGQLFTKKLLGVHEITEPYKRLISELQKINPAMKIIFTVSPVKHLNDGLIGNNISKATLSLAVHTLVSENPGCYYFPAYELVNDDLRDYRFYKDDLAHPNEAAVQYVWEKFSDTVFSTNTLTILEHLEKINRALAHRQMGSAGSGDPKLNEFVAGQKELVLKLDPSIRF